MKKNTFKITIFIFFIFFFIQTSFAQLSNFTFTVTATNETCTGNGTLAFSTSGTTSGATILYSIYLLPNQSNPIAVTSNSLFTGLVSGNYNVVATQTLGALTNSQQQNVVIQNLTNPIVYQVVTQQETCNDGSIIINVSQGNPVSYEIISGPVIIAPQATNTFAGLQSGIYNVRVNDACGDGVVQTVTVLQLQYLTIGNFTKNCQLLNCSTTSGSFSITANTGFTINYPLTVSFTLLPSSGGTPVIVNQVVNSGAALEQSVSINIPFNIGQNGYTINVTDSCGNSFFNNGNTFTNNLTLQLSPQSTNSCDKQINLSLCDFLPPYTVSFLSFPSGFNPQLFNSNHPGPFTVPQIDYTSNNTNNIPNGTYVVQVTDACGRTAQNSVLISNFLHQIIIAPIQDFCSPLTHVVDNPGGPNIATVVITAAPATYGFPLPHNVTFNVSNGNFAMNLLPGTYTFMITDVCGITNLSTLIIPPKDPIITAIGGNSAGCSSTTGFINITAINTTLVTVIVTQAPSAYPFMLPRNVSSEITPSNTGLFLPFLPPGNYTFLITNGCGTTSTYTANVPIILSQAPLIVDYKKGCSVDYSSVMIYSPNGPLQTMTITAAPATFTQILPYNVSFNISPNGRFYMNSLPEGLYTFSSVDACGVAKTSTILIVGYEVTTNSVQITGNCGSFNLNLQYINNAPTSPHQFWLQRFNSVTNQWEHALTGVPYTTGTIPNTTNSLQLVNLTTQFNIGTLGTFRVLKSYFVYSNGVSALTSCVETINEFEFTGELEIVSVFGIPCSSGGTSVIVNATGLAPLNYSITTKDGLPFIVNNGTSNNFSGLQPGIYNFQVTDFCGNVANSLLDITTLEEPEIVSSNLCDGLIGQLSVQPFAFLNYQWWKGTATTTILSTTNVLSFNPFSNTTTPGTYYVRIFSPNSSCVDRILEFIVPTNIAPNAGQDGVLTLCGGTSNVNLNSILIGNFDSNGTWSEVTTSGGFLNNNLWSPTGVSFGTYTFKHTVTGFCSSFDEALVTINYNQAPSVPVINAVSSLCDGDSIQLSVQTISNATYLWTGPNNYQSTIQNPVISNVSVINSGIYTVKAIINGCEATASTTVTIYPIPNFSIVAQCVSEKFTVLVSPVENSFNSETVTYNWQGPSGYSSSQNPIQLNGQPSGIYTVTVTNENGCETSQSVTVLNTLCTIPKGISPNGDGSNDTFDLSGFDVTNLKIFNRYGMVVYELSEYEDQWKGQDYNGNLLPSATYYYYVELNSGEARTGWVYLSRIF